MNNINHSNNVSDVSVNTKKIIKDNFLIGTILGNKKLNFYLDILDKIDFKTLEGINFYCKDKYFGHILRKISLSNRRFDVWKFNKPTDTKLKSSQYLIYLQ